MNIKQWTVKQIVNVLERKGYALTRTSIAGSGWEAVLNTALPPRQDGQPLVLDIGANLGGFCEMVASHCPTATVYAFEPIPDMIQKIETLSKTHPNIVIVPVAMGSEAHVTSFNVHAHVDASSLLSVRAEYQKLYPDQASVTKQIEIRVEKLDDWAAQNGLAGKQVVDLMKIDVQGYEGQVIAGGREVLRATRFSVVEAALYPSYEGGIMLDELSAVLRQLDFELIWAFNVFAGSCDLFWKNKALVAA